MIFVILTNTEMCNVHISMILEGLEYCILSRKAFAKVTQKAGRLSSICLLICNAFWYPIYPTGPSAMGRCAFCYIWNVFSVVVFQTSMLYWGSTSALAICAFCYMWNLFSVEVLHRSMVNWRRGVLFYVHSSISETYLV